MASRGAALAAISVPELEKILQAVSDGTFEAEFDGDLNYINVVEFIRRRVSERCRLPRQRWRPMRVEGR